MTLILWCLQYLQQRKLERLERVSKRFTGSEYFPYSTVSLQLSHPTINTTMDQFLFLLKTKFLDLDGVNGLTLTRFPSSVSSLHCFRLSIRLVHRLCQSFKCGSLKCWKYEHRWLGTFSGSTHTVWSGRCSCLFRAWCCSQFDWALLHWF